MEVQYEKRQEYGVRPVGVELRVLFYQKDCYTDDSMLDGKFFNIITKQHTNSNKIHTDLLDE